MASRHWNKKTGRGRLNINKSAAKAIVKKAGPLDRHLFVDTNRTVPLYASQTLVAAGAGSASGYIHLPLFNTGDFDTVANSQRERVRVSSVELRMVFRNDGAASGTYGIRHFRWWIFKAGQAEIDEALASQVSPWITATIFDFADADQYVLRRGQFDIPFVATVDASTANPMVGNVLAHSRHIKNLYFKHKRPFWIKENEQIMLGFQWWTQIYTGLAAGLPSISSGHDTLIRWARF